MLHSFVINFVKKQASPSKEPDMTLPIKVSGSNSIIVISTFFEVPSTPNKFLYSSNHFLLMLTLKSWLFQNLCLQIKTVNTSLYTYVRLARMYPWTLGVSVLETLISLFYEEQINIYVWLSFIFCLFPQPWRQPDWQWGLSGAFTITQAMHKAWKPQVSIWPHL